jgi:ribonuclease BN (tRNA processing enzyme)
MKIKVLGCYGNSEAGFRLTSFLINDTILLDAGDAVSAMSFNEQARLEKVILSHAHLDHINSLPFIALNVHEAGNFPIEIIAPEAVLALVKSHIMNDKIWPDFSKIPSKETPVYKYRAIREREIIVLGNLKIMAIPVDHIIPTFGYVIKDNISSLIYTSDTCNIKELVEIGNELDDLKAFIVEVTFSSDYQLIADQSKHMTPKSLKEQLKHLKEGLNVYIYHMKSNQLEKIKEECMRIGRNIELLEQGKVYDV